MMCEYHRRIYGDTCLGCEQAACGCNCCCWCEVESEEEETYGGGMTPLAR